MKWFKRIVGILLSLQSIGFVSHVIQNVNMYLDGYNNVLGKAIFMGFIGLAFLIGGIMLFKSTLNKEESDESNTLKDDSMKKFGFGVVWFLAISMGILMVAGFIVGAIAGATDPENAASAGEAAGQAFGQKYAGIILLIALIASVVGSYLGWLPGTKTIEQEVLK